MLWTTAGESESLYSLAARGAWRRKGRAVMPWCLFLGCWVGGVNEIGLLLECEPSERPCWEIITDSFPKRNERNKTPRGELWNEALQCYATCRDPETHNGCVVVRETLAVPLDCGIIYSFSWTNDGALMLFTYNLICTMTAGIKFKLEVSLVSDYVWQHFG